MAYYNFNENLIVLFRYFEISLYMLFVMRKIYAQVAQNIFINKVLKYLPLKISKYYNL